MRSHLSYGDGCQQSRGEGERALLLPSRPRREEPEQEVAAPSFSEVLDVLFREELVALAFLRFVALFCQTGAILISNRTAQRNF